MALDREPSWDDEWLPEDEDDEYYYDDKQDDPYYDNYEFVFENEYDEESWDGSWD